MPSLENDTRMIMAILFVGAVSGVNVLAYAEYGITFPYGSEAHAVLFGISTIGAILMIKVLFDVFISDMIEELLMATGVESKEKKRTREESRNRLSNFKAITT